MSARSSNDCGIVIPSAFAVFKLMSSSNLAGCCTGRSAGNRGQAEAGCKVDYLCAVRTYYRFDEHHEPVRTRAATCGESLWKIVGAGHLDDKRRRLGVRVEREVRVQWDTSELLH